MRTGPARPGSSVQVGHRLVGVNVQGRGPARRDLDRARRRREAPGRDDPEDRDDQNDLGRDHPHEALALREVAARDRRRDAEPVPGRDRQQAGDQGELRAEQPSVRR